MWELDCEESWAPKNWCCWTVVLEKTIESPLDYKKIQPVHSEGDQPWDFFGRNDAKAETPVLCPPHAKSWLIGKDSDAGRDWGQEEKGTTEDEMSGWHHWLDGRESEWTPGVGDGQGGLVCCNSQGHKESDMTEQLNWTELKAHMRLHNTQWMEASVMPLITTWKGEAAECLGGEEMLMRVQIRITPQIWCQWGKNARYWWLLLNNDLPWDCSAQQKIVSPDIRSCNHKREKKERLNAKQSIF